MSDKDEQQRPQDEKDPKDAESATKVTDDDEGPDVEGHFKQRRAPVNRKQRG